MAQDIQKIVLKGDATQLNEAFGRLKLYADIFDAAQQRIATFIDGLESLSNLVCIDRHDAPTVWTTDVLLVFKPSELLLEFLAALAVEFDLGAVEQSGHGLSS